MFFMIYSLSLQKIISNFTKILQSFSCFYLIRAKESHSISFFSLPPWFKKKLFEKIKTAELDWSMMCTHYISEANVHQISSSKCRTQITWIETDSTSLRQHPRPIPLLHNRNPTLIQLKNYIYQWFSNEKILTVPEQIKQRAAMRKHILVLDMDETLVYTRREEKPSHSNYFRTQVGLLLCSFKEKICTLSPVHLPSNFLRHYPRSSQFTSILQEGRPTLILF